MLIKYICNSTGHIQRALNLFAETGKMPPENKKHKKEARKGMWKAREEFCL